MFDLLIDGYEPIRAKNYNDAYAKACYIAKKDNVPVVISCALGNFEREIVFPH